MVQLITPFFFIIIIGLLGCFYTLTPPIWMDEKRRERKGGRKERNRVELVKNRLVFY